ncbi:MAG TPA: DUF5916 domain-containing protein [Sandaracinaceae bacterium LLY-WYZ-13_1]|nr:DUF5916 domain-containing protein [Sandaracinaceae bacterium LLY-WYZ-13_1]
MSRWPCRLLALTVLAHASGAVAQTSDRPRLHAARRRGPIAIDGRLDEPDWARAPVASDFVERVPDPGAEPPVRTEVRVLVDDGAIYVGVTAYLAEGETPRALELTRDSGRIWSDDAITVKVDVRHDHRTTVGFAVNPAGAQIDFVALDNGRVFRREVDAVWESGTWVREDAWVAELRLPAAALRLPPGETDRVFGFNVTRDHNARQATYDWSHLPPEFGAMSAVHYGELDGLSGIGGGRPFVLNPYFLIGWPGREDWDMPVRLAAGGEVRTRLAEDVWGELTFLTDFAEVDLDAQVVNLDRFPLFFPERRPFFLTGLDVFQFGAQQEAQLFFTRRIGLDANANPVPIYGGLKVYGREGPVAFGVLDVATAATEDVRAANWGVARTRINLGEASYVGALVGSRTYLSGATGQPLDPEPHWSAGLDGLVRALDRRLELSGFGAVTAREGPEARLGWAGRAAVRWRGEQWMPSASALYLSEGFEPELGFLRRPAIFRADAAVPWLDRQPFDGVRRIQLGVSGRLETDHDFGTLLRLSGGWSAELETAGRWTVGADAEYVQDVVREPFELVPGLRVEAGEYRGAQVHAAVSSPSQRNPVVGFELTARNAFFGGTLYRAEASVAAAFGPHFRADVGAVGALLDFHDRDLVATLALNSILTVTPTPRLVVDVVGQLNTVSERFIGMARLRWRYLPGSDLFLVWREDVRYAAPAPTSERRVTLKISYRYDTVL